MDSQQRSVKVNAGRINGFAGLDDERKLQMARNVAAHELLHKLSLEHPSPQRTLTYQAGADQPADSVLDKYWLDNDEDLTTISFWGPRSQVGVVSFALEKHAEGVLVGVNALIGPTAEYTVDSMGGNRNYHEVPQPHVMVEWKVTLTGNVDVTTGLVLAIHTGSLTDHSREPGNWQDTLNTAERPKPNPKR